jgi:hypothetical protein
MYSLFKLLKVYKDNKNKIESYINNQSIENYNDIKDINNVNNVNKIMNVPIHIFLFFLIISIAFWVWALVVLTKYWKVIPNWARILGVLGLIFGFGPFTLIIVYVTKST